MTLCIMVVGLSDTVKQILQVLEEKMRELVTINDQGIHILLPLPSFTKEYIRKKKLVFIINVVLY